MASCIGIASPWVVFPLVSRVTAAGDVTSSLTSRFVSASAFFDSRPSTNHSSFMRSIGLVSSRVAIECAG